MAHVFFRLCIAFLFGLALATTCPRFSVAVGEEISAEDFLNSYRKARLRWSERMNRIAANYESETNYTGNPDGIAKRVRKGTLFFDQSRKVHRFTSNKFDAESRLIATVERVDCIADEALFQLSRDNSEQPFRVDHFSQRSIAGADSFKTAAQSANFEIASISLGPILFWDDLLDFATVASLVSIDRTTSELGSVLNITCVPENTIIERLELTLLEEFDFAVRRSRTEYRRSEGVTEEWGEVVIDYEKGEGDLMFPTRIKEFGRTVDESKVIESDSVLDIRYRNPESMDPIIFTPMGYGLPDFFHPDPSYFPFDHWLFWAATSALLVSSILIYRMRNRVDE